MPITFENALMYDTNRSLCLEDIYRMRAAFAGIHQFNFDSLADEDFSGLGNFTDAEGVWSTEFGIVTGDASATGISFDYAPLWHSAETPASFKVVARIPYSGPHDGTCLVFRGNGTDTYYVAELGWTHAAFYHVSGATVTTLSTIGTPVSIVGPNEIELAVYEHQYSEYEQDRYLFMSLSADGSLLLTAKDHIPDTVPGRYWGLAVRAGEVAKWENARIPDLSDVVFWASIDPGEDVLGAINRAVGDRVINHFVRGNGEIRAWRSKASDPDFTFDKDHELRVRYERDAREIITHVRMHYASGWVEAFDPEMYRVYGHRFDERYNADIYSKEEAYAEALAVLRRSKENATKCSFTVINAGYLLEPEDHIVLPDGTHWLIDAIDISVDRNIRTTIRGRRYAF